MKNTVQTWRQAKQDGVKIAMLTAYDYSTAKLEDEAGINGILVGDSLGNVILGYEDTLSVTMEDMIHHGAAVSRGAKNALVMIDMPFMSYQTSVYDAVVNAGRLMKEGRGNAVKLEGGKEVCPQIKAIVDAGIPVCAHLGLTPQHVNAFGGNKVQGKSSEAAQSIIDDAQRRTCKCQHDNTANNYVFFFCKLFPVIVVGYIENQIYHYQKYSTFPVSEWSGHITSAIKILILSI